MTAGTEDLARGFLLNAAARSNASSSVAPEAPTADYLHGFADGWEAGQVAAIALILSTTTGESPTTLIDEATAQAAVDSAFPFDLVIGA
ncbi:MAG TPA: hypothetical protein VF244_09220 [Acidimicrobiales bacterium]